ncbi:hypothetical protein GN244_ATG17844 [Phytophthora infestans]|uniref:Uncharacterized protein n=1 Tax=Phytophthora infestans TaxID=4787 RepID=A0A833W695_PHYIN|nr:hypothetical protein GN244_ATG17844 [Phytophthora infestans]KAF4142676.1 hypothetical protein GN958_ATG08140 [Phytophthora infestans]
MPTIFSSGFDEKVSPHSPILARGATRLVAYFKELATIPPGSSPSEPTQPYTSPPSSPLERTQSYPSSPSPPPEPSPPCLLPPFTPPEPSPPYSSPSSPPSEPFPSFPSPPYQSPPSESIPRYPSPRSPCQPIVQSVTVETDSRTIDNLRGYSNREHWSANHGSVVVFTETVGSSIDNLRGDDSAQRATTVRENSFQLPVQSVSVETDGTTIANLHVYSNSKCGSAWSVVSKVTIEHLHGDGNSQNTVFATLVADMATTGMTVSALTEKMAATCMAGSALTEKIPAGIAASSLK